MAYGDRKWSDEFSQRYEAWRDALIAMNRALETDEGSAWSAAAANWDIMARMHEGVPLDQKVYADLAASCGRKARAAQ
jgi:hypothetical protein